MIVGKIASAAVSLLPQKGQDILGFLTGDPSQLIGALLAPPPPKTPDPRDPAAVRNYEQALSDWYANYGVNPLAGAPRNLRRLSRDDRTGGVDPYGVLPGRHVQGGLLRVNRQNILDGKTDSVSSVLSTRGSNVPP